ncbi:MAG: hypothetical protein R2911_31140 [Caldilineaceae bacterium]
MATEIGFEEDYRNGGRMAQRDTAQFVDFMAFGRFLGATDSQLTGRVLGVIIGFVLIVSL